MFSSKSLTRQMIATVMLVEAVTAVVLVIALIGFEYESHLEAFDFALRGSLDSVVGAIRVNPDQSLAVDQARLHLRPDAVLLVTDSAGHTLASAGDVPPVPVAERPVITEVKARTGTLRFAGAALTIRGENGSTGNVAIRVGRPTDHVWHEVLEAVRFLAISCAMLLLFTGLSLAWLVKKRLRPLRELADSAGAIQPHTTAFVAPDAALQIMELLPLSLALEKAFQRLSSALEQQKRFTNDAAHELKTDVAIIKSSIQLMGLRAAQSRASREDFVPLEQDLKRLENTVQRMLTLARLEGEAPPDSRVESEIDFGSIIARLTSTGEVKGINISFHGARHCWVGMSTENTDLLLRNLLLNAIQHSPHQSTVDVRLSVQQHEIELTVADNGPGFEEADFSHLGEAFYRTDPSRARSTGGTGLGLSICRAICEAAGGTIAFANRPEGGAVVVVKLPANAGNLRKTSSKAV